MSDTPVIDAPEGRYRPSPFSIGLLIAIVVALVALAAVALATSVPTPRNALYIYMCGSTLETQNGAASRNISELLEADIPADTAVVIETGGAAKWRGHDIPSDSINRYVVEDGSLTLVESLPQADMGSAATLTDFLTFCEERYPADNEMLLFWDHGLGSTGAICFDELSGMDGLDPGELTQALSDAEADYDLVGFDACLMASLDTAARLAPHADYLIASEDIEPGRGWNYRALVEALGAVDETSELGKIICDGYLEKTAAAGKDAFATLSLLDLSKADETVAAFDAFASDLQSSASGALSGFSPVTATGRAVNFGGNSASEGYSNMIDLAGFAKAIERRSGLPSAAALEGAIDDMVVYQVIGDGREGATGLSLYYPVHYDRKELASYLTTGVSDNYNDYLRRVYGTTPATTITLADAGSVAEDGSFRIQLSPESRPYFKSVDFVLYEIEGDFANPVAVSQLGSDNDIASDLDTLTFNSNFRGVWPHLGDEPLNSTVIGQNGEDILFTAPVLVNGDRTNLRFAYVWDSETEGHFEILGLWDGVDDHALAAKEMRSLNPGDVVTVLTDRQNGAGTSELSTGPTVTIADDGGVITEKPLGGTNYRYEFVVTDIFGNQFTSATADFVMQVTPEQILSPEVIDRQYAADVVSISERPA